jgi:hypothetical protein
MAQLQQAVGIDNPEEFLRRFLAQVLRLPRCARPGVLLRHCVRYPELA